MNEVNEGSLRSHFVTLSCASQDFDLPPKYFALAADLKVGKRKCVTCEEKEPGKL